MNNIKRIFHILFIGDHMFPNTYNLSLGKIISGVSKTLNIVNQAIPLYNQIRPVIKNASGILNIFREFNKPDNETQKKITTKEVVTQNKPSNPSSNTLTFFQ